MIQTRASRLSLRGEPSANLTDDELSDNIQAVVTQKLEKPKNLNEESLKYWEEILDGLVFDRRELAAEVQKLSREACSPSS